MIREFFKWTAGTVGRPVARGRRGSESRRARGFVPTPGGDRLEDRALLSSFGGGNIDTSRPFVKNSTLPVSAINFTSNTYNQIETSISGVASTISKNITNSSTISGQLDKITARVPFGSQLQTILTMDIQSYHSGTSISASAAQATLTAVYERVLGRAPDAGAIVVGVPAIQAGTTVQTLALVTATSTEFDTINTTDTSSLTATRTQYLTALYTSILGRTPDPSGLAYWMGQLAAGENPTTIATTFVNSPEDAVSPKSILNQIPNPTKGTPTYYFGATNANGTIPGPFGGTSSQAQISNLIFSDLNAYLNAGEGTQFNVLKSHVNFSTDNYLTYNGRVS